MSRLRALLFVLAATVLPGVAEAACTVPYSFVNGTIIDAGQMNTNFSTLVTCLGDASSLVTGSVPGSVLTGTYHLNLTGDYSIDNLATTGNVTASGSVTATSGNFFFSGATGGLCRSLSTCAGVNFVGYDGTSMILRNTDTAPSQTYVAAGDNGHVSLQNGDGTQCTYNGGATLSCTSDARLKYYASLAPATDRVMALKPVVYSLKADPEHTPHLGFTGQDVEREFPQLVSKNSDGTLMLDYSGLIAPLVATVQEQNARIDELEALLKRRKE
jgi:Chaperone of endosialidase